MRFLNAFDAVETGAVSQCVAAKGFHFPTPSPQIVYSGDNTEFPYLSYLGTHGFGPTLIGTSVATDPTKGMTQAERTDYKAATHGCRTTTSAVFDPALQSGSTLQDQWMSMVAKIDTEAPFQRALGGWRTCTQHAGVHVSTIQAFFSYADSQRVHGGGLQGSIRLAAIYARCLAPAEALRDRLRQRARTVFVRTHATAVAQLIASVNAVMRPPGR
jgi:hypothetical protein